MAPHAEVHVWHVDVDSRRPRAAVFAALCNPAEVRRASDIQSVAQRERFLVRHGLLQVLLGSYSVGDGGRAMAVASGCVGAEALFAFGSSVSVGVSIVPVPDGDPAIGRLPGLTNRERLLLARAEPPTRSRGVAVLLAAKEALGNARGRGLDAAIAAVELGEVVVPAVDGGSFEFELDGLAWAGAVLPLGHGRLACVVHDGARRPIRTYALPA